jgi:hypothetical protein
MRLIILAVVAAQPQENAADMFKNAEDELQHFDQTDLRSLAQYVKPAQPASLLEESASPDEILQTMEKKQAKARRDLRTAEDAMAPSSFVEEGTPDSFADIDAKLKALEEKTKAELAKLQSDTAAPSSFAEVRPSSLVQEGASSEMHARSALAQSLRDGAQEAEIELEKSQALENANVADLGVSVPRSHSQHVEVKDFKEAMEASMTAQKKKLASFLENMKEKFHKKLQRDANATHADLQAMRRKEAEELQAIEEKHHISKGSLLEDPAKFHAHTTIDPELLKQSDAAMERSRGRIAKIQEKLSREESRMRKAAQQLAQSNAPDFSQDSLSLDVLNSHNFRKQD